MPDLVLAPELAAIVILEHALAIARDALLAEHMTLIDDFSAHEQSPVLLLARVICRREAALRGTLQRYRRAVHNATTLATEDSSDDDLF